MFLRQQYLLLVKLALESGHGMNHVGVMMRSIGSAAGGTRTEAKLQALAWLRTRLEWERTLAVLRGEEDDAAEKAA